MMAYVDRRLDAISPQRIRWIEDGMPGLFTDWLCEHGEYEYAAWLTFHIALTEIGWTNATNTED